MGDQNRDGWGGRYLRDAERHEKHDRKHLGPNGQVAGLSFDEKRDTTIDPIYGYLMRSLVENEKTEIETPGYSVFWDKA